MEQDKITVKRIEEIVRRHCVCRCEDAWTKRNRHAPDCLWENAGWEILSDLGIQAERFPNE